MIDKFKESFREEAYELLNTLEQSLLHLEENPDDGEEISAIFRAVHTIKGSSDMFGFEEIAHFTHELESTLDMLRQGTIKADHKLVDLSLKSKDHIRTLLDGKADDSGVLGEKSESLIRELRTLLPHAAIEEKPVETRTSAPAASGENGKTAPATQEEGTYRIRFTPGADIFRNGTQPLSLIKELCAFGHITIVPNMSGIPEIDDIDPECCYSTWSIILSTSQGMDAIRSVFEFALDNSDLRIEAIDGPSANENVPLGRILIEQGAADFSQIEHAASKQKRLGEILVEEGLAPDLVKAALEEQNHIRKVHQLSQAETGVGTVRVAAAKLDVLVDLVGELVTLQARLSQTMAGKHDAVLSAIGESLERLTGDIRDSAMSMRMLPIGSSFSKFKRLVRDLSQELGKEVQLSTEGAETELDKTVIEKLNDPLVHLIRNSLDHGIEDPRTRVANGKEREGQIRLAAQHAGASVVISISDDGQGIDLQGVRKKAVERGIRSSESTISDEDALSLIFAPGFSTAKKLSKVSGRGVGLDVVKRELEGLGGSVRVESGAGSGTTFRLEIPLTLAIIDGLMVKVGSELYVIHLSAVEECREWDGVGSRGMTGMLGYRDELIPTIKLRDVFEVSGPESVHQQIVIAHAQGRHFGIVVDSVIGDHQTVIKGLGKMYQSAHGLSGATILGDGNVALVLDLGGILTYAGGATGRTAGVA